MKKLLVILMAAMLLLGSAAMAEIQVETLPLENMIMFSRATGCYYMRVDNGYQLFDSDGNALTPVYRGITAKSYGQYYTYYNSSSQLNYMGLLDANGQVISQPAYGQFYSYDGGWGLAFVLEPVASDTGDFKDSDNNCYNVVRTDVYLDGRFLGSLSREEYLPSYSTGQIGGLYLTVKTTSESGYYLDRNFGRYYVEDRYISSSEYSYDYKTDSVTHLPTGTKAFCPECTLTPDDVLVPLYYDSDKDCLLDLQGNVVKSGLVYDSVYCEEGGVRAKSNRSYAILDSQGNVLSEPIYKDVSSTYGMFPQGYQAAVTNEGHLHFLDPLGNVTAKAEYELAYSDYKGYNSNAIFACVKNMGKVIVITATHGELPTKYDDYLAANTYHRVLRVQQDGLWGAIDTAGNVVIPFVLRSSPEISDDSTILYGQKEDRSYVIYRLTYTDDTVAVEEEPAQPEATPAPAADDAWTCSCGAITTGKFCPECGTKKPEPTPTPVPVDDGSWTCSCGATNTSKFCPECGSARPEAAPECSGCGYKPEGETPRFCPECGTRF